MMNLKNIRKSIEEIGVQEAMDAWHINEIIESDVSKQINIVQEHLVQGHRFFDDGKTKAHYHYVIARALFELLVINNTFDDKGRYLVYKLGILLDFWIEKSYKI